MQPIEPSDHKLVTLEEAGRAIGTGVSPYIVGKLVASGDLQRVTVGTRKHFITGASLDAYLERIMSAAS